MGRKNTSKYEISGTCYGMLSDGEASIYYSNLSTAVLHAQCLFLVTNYKKNQ